MRNLTDKAREAKDKKAAIGPDVDLATFTAEPVRHDYVKDLKTLPVLDRDRLIQAGIDTSEDGRAGTYIQMDTAVVHAHAKQEGLEVIPIKEALKKHEWARIT